MRIAVKLGASLACLLALFAFGFSWRDLQQGRAPSPDAYRQLLGLTPAGGKMATATKLFKDSFARIRADYYKPIDAKDLKYAGLSGMLAALGDPHTMFLEPRMAQEFRLETEARFAGVGARLAPDTLGARVAVVFVDGPAARAGLKEGDLITTVDGRPVGGRPIDEIVSKIRGPKGTNVTLTVVRAGLDKPKVIRITRADVVAPTVESKMLPESGIGYIEITLFSQPTGEQFERALRNLEQRGMRGLVIDLRGNPGGLLDSAVELLSRFVEDKVVVKMRLKDGREEVARSMRGERHNLRVPVVALMDEDSASAAEIFAGVLRDYKIATLVGEHTYGKASVQNVFQLIDGAGAKITIAKYYLPGGQDISRKVDADGQYVSGGLEPDVEAPLDFDLNPTLGDPKTDSQLQRAIEFIRSKLVDPARAAA